MKAGIYPLVCRILAQRCPGSEGGGETLVSIVRGNPAQCLASVCSSSSVPGAQKAQSNDSVIELCNSVPSAGKSSAGPLNSHSREFVAEIAALAC
jgi:hypothetical protein